MSLQSRAVIASAVTDGKVSCLLVLTCNMSSCGDQNDNSEFFFLLVLKRRLLCLTGGDAARERTAPTFSDGDDDRG